MGSGSLNKELCSSHKVTIQFAYESVFRLTQKLEPDFKGVFHSKPLPIKEFENKVVILRLCISYTTTV